MTAPVPSSSPRQALLPELGLLVLAALIAVSSAQKYAGGWNDGSRLATVECLVDHGTLVIDQSIFVQVPPRTDPETPLPYPADELGLLLFGTGDKLLIDGHFYSDKSPVPALLLAGLYGALRELTGLQARPSPDRFCYWLTLGSSGLAYVIAVWCVYRLGGLVRLRPPLCLALALSFALATTALPYARHVNNHILLLAVAALLFVQIARLGIDARTDSVPWVRPAAIGGLAGLAYVIDLGTGPVLFVCLLPLVAYRCRRVGPVVLAVLAALPWIALHHAVNYAVGGTFKPANAVADYFNWPGCTFNAQNMTGAWNHPSVGHFLLYAADLLVGKRGFLGHDLPLFLAVAGMAALLWRRGPELPEVLFAVGWCGGTWLIYALTSNNYSGLCCSVRWFVPLLAPCYYILALFLQRYPRYVPDFLVLSGWGAVMATFMWRQGPWMKHMVPGYWVLVGGALLSWLLCRHWARTDRKGTVSSPATEPTRQGVAA